MRRFAALYDALDATTSTNAKVDALARYFADAPPADAAWAMHFLSGGRLKRLIAPRLLGEWCVREAVLPGWLFGECWAVAGDYAEIIALTLDTVRGGARVSSGELSLSTLIEQRLLPLRGASEEEQRQVVVTLWAQLERREIFLLNKLLTGELRVGVSATLAVRALARHAGLEPGVIAHRLMGGREPSAEAFRALIAAEHGEAEASRPYPFFLASPLESAPEELGDLSEWLAEWKWDGIRAQLIRRSGKAWLWSRGEELIGDRFPDLAPAFEALPEGTVLDGEVLAWSGAAPLPFAVLQRRIGRKTPGPKILAEAPAAFMAYDLLELAGHDLRGLPLRERRARLETLVRDRHARLTLSPAVTAPSWEALRALRATARERGVEGLMLKRWDSPYRHGRPRGEWWKWKIDPFTIDAVLLYAQPGSGRRASLLTDMTFGLWDRGELVPVAKAYSGLTDEELDRADRWIRENTLERFGPVRHVKPEHVFELHFEAIAASPRHRSGIAVRFPRIARWRTDKKPEDADTLDALRALVKVR